MSGEKQPKKLAEDDDCANSGRAELAAMLSGCPSGLTTAEAIAELLSSSDEADQAHYAIRLGAIHCKEAVEPLCGLLSKALESKSERLVIASLYALYCVCDVRSLPALLSAFPALYDRPRHLCIMALTRVLTRCVESVFQNEVGDTVQNSRVKFQFLRELLPEPGHLLRVLSRAFSVAADNSGEAVVGTHLVALYEEFRSQVVLIAQELADAAETTT